MADCLFCRMVSGEIAPDLVAQNAGAIAFRDINPVAPVHVLVIPRSHHANLADVAQAEPAVVADMLALVREVASSEGVADGGYRLVANTGADAHQTVFHAHVHVLGGRKMGSPPG